MRQGFDVQTVFAWPVRNGRIDILSADHGDGALTLQYADGARISRVNKGLRRRKDEAGMGFWINPQSGWWSKLEDEDDDAPRRPDRVPPQKIVPIVQDHKNALLVKFADTPSEATHATLQTALLRGIDALYQLEEGEILAEPLPGRKERRTILAYEAAEGGAGVLNALLTGPQALAQVARKALEIMHFSGESIARAIAAGDALLLDDGDHPPCVQGCYRCLLSYCNQPDHLLIDRHDPDALARLIHMAASDTRVQAQPADEDRAEHPDWLARFAEAGLPPPAPAGRVGGMDVSWRWPAERIAACALS